MSETEIAPKVLVAMEDSTQYGRLKGAEWFPFSKNLRVLILGQGGIGSWLTLFASRIGCTIVTVDMDVFEEHNMSGQFVSKEGIGKNKAVAVSELVALLNPDTAPVGTIQEPYTAGMGSNDVILCGFDNMKARKEAFMAWKEHLTPVIEDRKHYFFQDGRLLAEQLQIFNIPGDRADLIEKYEKEYLFDDSEVKEADCTFKQTSHCAAMIGAQMTAFLTNWLVKSRTGDFRSVPFFYEYVIPLSAVSKQ